MGKSLSPRQNFCLCNKSHKISYLCSEKIWSRRQNFPVYTKRFVTAMFFSFFFSCHHDVLLRLVVRPVHKEWFVTATFCSDMLPSVFRLELFSVKCAQNLKVHFSTIGCSIQSRVHSTLHVNRLSPNVHISHFLT